MDGFEKVGYTCLALIALLYGLAMLAGIVSVFPFGVLGLIAVIGVGALFIKVLKERLGNAEDDHYSKTVDK